ncbi:MAG: hypothetical protein ACPHUO_06660, partial [Candidatus Poseidoniaceae archaeon]
MKVLTPVKTKVLTPVEPKVLEPVKRRGPPPSSAPGQRPGVKVTETPTATLSPIKKLKPIDSKLDTDSED